MLSVRVVFSSNIKSDDFQEQLTKSHHITYYQVTLTLILNQVKRKYLKKSLNIPKYEKGNQKP